MKIEDVVAYLDDRFHPEYQEDYDNAGFLVGEGSAEYKGALVALDLTAEVVDEAKAAGLNLIVTHHPLIFGGLKSVTSRTATGRLVIDMVRSGIAAYAAHTNLDNMPDGVNGILCEKLGLKNTRILKLSTGNRELETELGAGMVGELEVETAMHAGADAYLTGDLKYHDFQRPEGRMLLADIGHYESEQFAREIISRAISEKFSNFACRISECQHSVVHYM